MQPTINNNNNSNNYNNNNAVRLDTQTERENVKKYLSKNKSPEKGNKIINPNSINLEDKTNNNGNLKEDNYLKNNDNYYSEQEFEYYKKKFPRDNNHEPHKIIR